MMSNAVNKGRKNGFNLLNIIAFIISYCEIINKRCKMHCIAVKIAVFRLIANNMIYEIRIKFYCSAIVEKLICIMFLSSFSYICVTKIIADG
jgi:hypothetical protein